MSQKYKDEVLYKKEGRKNEKYKFIIYKKYLIFNI